MTKIIPKPRVSTHGCLAALFTTRNRGYAITALLLIISTCIPACSTAKLVEPRSEPVAQLIRLLSDENPEIAADALYRLQVVSGKNFQTQQEWQTWYKDKVESVLQQLEQGCRAYRRLVEARKYAQWIRLLDSQDKKASSDALARLRETTGQQFDKKQEWENWFRKYVQSTVGYGKGIMEAGKYRITQAVPLLERHMEVCVGESDYFRNVVAQTLHLIGTPEASKILRKYLVNEMYDTQQSTHLVYSMKLMPQNAIDSFVKEYHVSSTSDRLKVELHYQDKYRFKVVITNTSKADLQILDRNHWLGSMLFFFSPDGHFLRSVLTIKYRIGPRRYILLKVGQSKTYELAGKLRKTNKYLVREFKQFESNYMLKINRDKGHILGPPGEYTVYAFYSHPRYKNRKYPDKVVFGHWVSEPIKVKIEW